MTQRKRTLYRFGPFRLDGDRRLLFRGRDVIPIPAKAFETLLTLVESRGKLLSKDELMKRVWPDTFVEEGNLTVNIFALRRVLGERPEEHRYILTVPGQGYRFVGGAARSPGGGRRRKSRAGGALPMTRPPYTASKCGSSRTPAAARGVSASPVPAPFESARLRPGPAGGAVALDSEFYIVRRLWPAPRGFRPHWLPGLPQRAPPRVQLPAKRGLLEANGNTMLRIRCALYNGTFEQIFADYMATRGASDVSP